MSRGLCVLAALVILASGCASRRAVDRLGSDVGRLRSELAEMRVAQEATSRDLANVTSKLQALDVRTLGEEVARLTRRADAGDTRAGAVAERRACADATTRPDGRAAAKRHARETGAESRRHPGAGVRGGAGHLSLTRARTGRARLHRLHGEVSQASARRERA